MEATTNRAVWLDYLRSFITLLVVAHHAALAYPTFAHFDTSHYIWSTAPVVDGKRWLGMDLFIGFNDLFFMSMMFFISGLFVNRGLVRKGASAYWIDRFLRLGIPFIVAELVLIPLAYIPSFYLSTHSTNFVKFIKDYLINQQWPVGPPWFIWLLLLFDGLATLIYTLRPSFFIDLGNILSRLSKRPLLFVGVIYGLICVALIPLSLWVGQYTWVGNWGPFDFQLNRLLFYLAFYLIGCCLGAVEWQRYLFSQNKLLGRNWVFWIGLSLISYLLFVLISQETTALVRLNRLSTQVGYFIFDLVFVASCLASMGACVSVFKQTVIHPSDRWTNLSANAYGIYIVHYGFVTWLQFALLYVDIPVVVKFGLVFLGALMLSWLLSSLIRRNARIAQFI